MSSDPIVAQILTDQDFNVCENSLITPKEEVDEFEIFESGTIHLPINKVVLSVDEGF